MSLRWGCTPARQPEGVQPFLNGMGKLECGISISNWYYLGLDSTQCSWNNGNGSANFA